MKIKLILLITTLTLILSACEFPPDAALTETPIPKPAAEPAQVETAPEVEEVAPEPTATFTPEPEIVVVEEKQNCLDLLIPLDKADLPAEGKVVFSWTTHDSAESYSLNFIFPDELTLSFDSTETTKNRYMEAFSMHPAYSQSGEHQWNVTALNADGEEICHSDFFTFTKAISGNVSQGNGGDENENSSGCTGFDCGEGGTGN